MKKITVVLAIAFLITSCNQKHIGEWKGVDNKGKPVSLILDNNNYATFVFGNLVLKENENLECKYEIDYSKNPIWLDIIVYDKRKQNEKLRIKGIVQFLSETKMEFRGNAKPNGDHFENFDSNAFSDDITVFEKVSN